VWAAFHTVATARAIDYFGARFRLPLPEVVPTEAIGGQWFYNLRRLAWYNTSRAALRLAQRNPAEAERILRETVSVGLRVDDESRWPGVEMIREGRRALDQLARLTGRTVPGLGRAHDSLPSAPAERGSESLADLGARRPRANALAAATDTLRSRATRYNGLAGLVYLPCTNVREMIFGPDPDILDTFDSARRTLARFPSDSARIDALERIATGERPERIESSPQDLPLLFAAVRWVVRSSARVLGAPRLARCFAPIWST
jgi:hypothetical protein